MRRPDGVVNKHRSLRRHVVSANHACTRLEAVRVISIRSHLARGTVVQPLGSGVQALLYASGQYGVRLGKLLALQHAPHVLGNALCHPARGDGDVAVIGVDGKAARHVGHLLGQGVADVLGVHADAPWVGFAASHTKGSRGQSRWSQMRSMDCCPASVSAAISARTSKPLKPSRTAWPPAARTVTTTAGTGQG